MFLHRKNAKTPSETNKVYRLGQLVTRANHNAVDASSCALVGTLSRGVHISEFQGKTTLHPRRRHLHVAMLFWEIWATLLRQPPVRTTSANIVARGQRPTLLSGDNFLRRCVDDVQEIRDGRRLNDHRQGH